MTHSGGKAHEVGDRGQRYEVSVFDEPSNKRIVVGWTDDAETARKMADGAALRPSWKFEWVTDRLAAIHRPSCYALQTPPKPCDCDARFPPRYSEDER